jgi:hypothetical protein
MHNQHMKHSGDLRCYLGLDWYEVFRRKFLAARPQVISRRCLGDPNVGPQHPVGTALLNTPRDHVFEFGWVWGWKVGGPTPFARYPRECETATASKEANDKAVGEIVDEKLLFRMAGQIAQRRDGHGNAR